MTRLQNLANKLRLHYCVDSVEKLNDITEEVIKFHVHDEEKLKQMIPIMREMSLCMENKDCIGLADIIEYRLNNLDPKNDN